MVISILQGFANEGRIYFILIVRDFINLFFLEDLIYIFNSFSLIFQNFMAFLNQLNFVIKSNHLLSHVIIEIPINSLSNKLVGTVLENCLY